MRRKNQKRTKKFNINLQIEPHIFELIDQLDMLCDSTRKAIITEMVVKGYKPTSKQRLIPYNTIDKDAPRNTYRLSIDGVYIGKRKAREEVEL